MTFVFRRAALGMSLIAGLSACVPTTPPQGAGPVLPAAATAPLEKNTAMYLGTSDNGFSVPTVPVEKVPDEFERQEVEYVSNQPVGTIIINPGAKHLYFITGANKAIRYGVSVGKAGFEWSGEANITNRKPWPTWTPPKEMIERKPELSKWENGQPGGPTNPLGARALYLTTNGRDYGYRIHGTPDWWSIGKNASSGCIRMINQDVMDLYNRVPDGAKVVVLNRDGSMPTGLKLPPPQPKKKQPAPVARPEIATVAPEATVLPVAGTVAPGTVTPGIVTPGAVSPGTGTQAPVVAAPEAALGNGATSLPAAVTTPVAPTPPTVPVVTPQTTAPAAMPTPGVDPSPIVTPPAAPLSVPVCAVPLVNGLCPQG